MKILLLCIFTIIFYTILTEFTSEELVVFNSDTTNTNITDKKAASSQQRVEASAPTYIVDDLAIKEALRWDEDIGSFSGAQDSLEEALLGSLAEQQLSEEASLEYKKQFIRKYLERAKQAGYDIKLNDQLQVISMKRRTVYEPILIDDEQAE